MLVRQGHTHIPVYIKSFYMYFMYIIPVMCIYKVNIQIYKLYKLYVIYYIYIYTYKLYREIYNHGHDSLGLGHIM